MITKICSKCKLEKENTEFRKCAKAKDSLKYYCKSCDDEYGKTRYRNDPEKQKKKVKKWQRKNPELVQGYIDKYWQKKKAQKTEQLYISPNEPDAPVVINAVIPII